MKSRHKWMTWLGLVLAFFTFTAAMALVLSPASASGFPLSLKIRSNLSADYRYGESTASLGVFRLSIIGDMLRDMGMGEKEASQHENVMRLVMEASVPTATAFDFEGGSPLTATPTKTATLTDTPTSTPTSTATNTPRPTATNTKTPKPKATKTPKPPTAIVDVQAPSILSSSLDPTPGPELTGCELILTVDVMDPAYSEGVDRIQAKHTIPSGEPDTHNYTTFGASGSYDGDSNWVGTFSGTIDIKYVSGSQSIEVYFKAWDVAGNHSPWEGPYHYTLAAANDCD
ncbi:MAG: hypothetical protein PVI04_03005 [Anaerolineales bacterium]